MKRILLLPLFLLISLGANAQCVASFTSSPLPQGNALLQYHFTNTSTYGAGIWTTASNFDVLNFGDGAITSGAWSTLNNTYHTYAAPGTYNVGMRVYKVDTITHAVLCTDTTTQTITVGYSACGSTIAMSVVLNGAATFTANTPAGTTGMTYSWSFGDGGTGTGSPVTHTYLNNGTYTVTLVSTGGGCSYTNTYSATINNTSITCGSLHAAFSTTLIANTVTFYNTSTSTAGLIKVSTWTYGDGTTGTSNTHTYPGAGSYSAALKVQWLDSLTQTVYCQDSTTQLIIINPVTNIIIGVQAYDTTGTWGIPHTFKTWLIKHDSLTNYLYAVDSQTQTTLYGVAPYYFSGQPAGNYLVKTALLNQTVGASGFMPTYHDSSLYWNTAQQFYHPGVGYTNASIFLRQGTVTSGPGFVGGNVSLGANKGASDGVPGITVFLRDAANKAIASTTTDANGDFSFSNIPIGTYSVYPENLNYATTAKTNLSVTAAVPSVIDAFFNQDNTQMNIKPFSLSVGGPSTAVYILSVYPNPASKSVNIFWKGIDPSGAHLIITNTSGQIVIDEAISKNNSGFKTINISTLTPGVYFLRGTAGLQGQVQKLIVE